MDSAVLENAKEGAAETIAGRGRPGRMPGLPRTLGSREGDGIEWKNWGIRTARGRNLPCNPGGFSL